MGYAASRLVDWDEPAMSNVTDLAEILPEDWFDELPEKPESELTAVDFGAYLSNCPELVGDFNLTLYKDKSGRYYVRRLVQEPIGDYGTRWVDTWYSCNNNGGVEVILR